MKKCNSCGFPNEDDARFCATCGASLTDEPFTPEVMPKVVVNSSEPEKSTSVQSSGSSAGAKGKAAAVRDKAVAFENKHSIIVNAIVAVCAIVIALIVLLAPINTVEYVSVSDRDLVGNVTIEDDSDEGGAYSYVEVKQSLWQMLGAIGYIKYDEKKQAEINEEVQKALTAAAIDYVAWAAQHQTADETEALNAMSEIFADHLSDVNYFAHILANTGMVEEDADIKIPLSGDYWAAALSLGLGLIVTLLAFIMAIISLVFLIKAIVGMAKKQSQPSLFKYLRMMLGISGSGLSCMFAAPMLAAGGGMFAAALFTAIVYLICGLVGSLAFGNGGIVKVVMRAVVAVIAMIAFFILCNNLFSLNTIMGMEDETTTMSVYGHSGFGLYKAFSVLDVLFNEGNGAGDFVAYTVCSGIVGVVFYLLIAGIAIPLAFKAMSRSLRKLALGDAVKSTGSGSMIAAAVFMLIAIVAGLTFSGKLVEIFIGVFGDKPIDGYSMTWTMLAPLWASMIMLVVAAIVNLIFNRKGKTEEPAPAQAA